MTITLLATALASIQAFLLHPMTITLLATALALHLGKIFTSQSYIVKLDSSVLENQSRDLGTSTSGEVGQSYFFAVASFHLQALAETFSQFLDHFLLGASFSHFSPN